MQSSQSSPLRRALAALEQVQSKLAAAERLQREPIAVVGLACRFPGGASTPERFWQILAEGRDTIAEVPRDRWDIDRYYDPDPDASGKMSCRFGAFIDGIDTFDAQLFGITPREAAAMDPQQRLLLETSWHALENAGMAPDRLGGRSVGVFAGVVNHDWDYLCRRYGAQEQFGAYYASGVAHGVVSGRVAYALGLQGPAITIDTACSSSLVAVHLAVRSLRAGDCEVALAGGVNAILSPEASVALTKYRMLASDGRCKTFDASADGYSRGEGCGVVVLKRLSDALTAGDTIMAVIRGSAINQDGASSGLTAPNGPAQEAVIRAALADADVAPSDVTFVETHGTGTALGDPIELQALARALGADRARERPLIVGSVKTNVGHLEAAAGVAGLIKLVLCLRNREIPPNLHLQHPNPLIAWDRLAVELPRTVKAWPAEAPMLGGVSSFGFSGTNVHIVVAGPPDDEPGRALGRPQHLLVLSAHTPGALSELAEAAHEQLRHESDPLGNVAHTSGAGRAQLTHRVAVRAATHEDARRGLRAFLAQETVPGLHTGTRPSGDSPRVAFLFTGQGAQYVNMGRHLYETEARFRDTMLGCAEALRPFLPHSLLQVLYPAPGDEEGAAELLAQTAYTQPALFAIECALASLWRSWGVQPAALLGHSVGEYAAACVAGVFSLEEGAALVAERARLMQATPPIGAMGAILTDPQRVIAAVANLDERVGIAAFNGPANVVVSGEREAVDHLLRDFEESGVRTRRLRVSHAFHSPLTASIREPFAKAASGIRYNPPQLRLISNVSGQIAGRDIASAEYWVRHVRAPVQFASGMAALDAEHIDLFVEVGPGTTLLGMGGQCIERPPAHWVASLREGRDDWTQILDALGLLFTHGVDVDWDGFDRPFGYRPAAFPCYPFQRQRHWLRVTTEAEQERVGEDVGHALLGRRLRSALPEAQFEAELVPERTRFIADHSVDGVAILPGAAFMEIALAARAQADANVVEDLLIAEPLLFADDSSRVVQTVITSEGALRIMCEEAPGQWRLHASARLRNAPDGEIQSLESPASIQARCSETRSAEQHRAHLRARGLDFGPSLHGVAAVWRRDGEALGLIEAPLEVQGDAAGFVAHPALLDACLQIVAAAMPVAGAGAPYLPWSCERIRSREKIPTRTRVWSHSVLRSSSDAATLAMPRADIRIFDDTGRVLLELEGLVLRQRASAPPLADALYEMEWQPAPPLAPEPGAIASTAQLVASASAVIANAAGAYATESDFLPQLETLSTRYIARALHELGVQFVPGTRISVADVRAHCATLPRYDRLLNRWFSILHEDGVLEQLTPNVWRVVQSPDTSDAEPDADRLVEQYPDFEPQTRVSRACGGHLAQVLTGRADALALLFPGGSTEIAEQLYGTSPKARVFNSAVEAVLRGEVEARAPAGRTLRVLEVGAGTGSTTAAVLPLVAAADVDYVFTDISPAFVARARDRFREHARVRYQVLDIERDPAPQGFSEPFDVIVAVNVLHATADLSRTLGHVRRLLAPGGMLLLVEGTAPERWIDITFGLTEGWWRFADLAVRADYPLISVERWQAVLEQSGFTQVAFTPADATDRSQAIVVARAEAPAPAARPERDLWLLHGAAPRLGAELGTALETLGQRVSHITTELAAQPLQTSLDNNDVRGIVVLNALKPEAAEPRVNWQNVCFEVVELVRAVSTRGGSVPQLVIVTRGAQRAGDVCEVIADQATLWGLAGVIRREHPELQCRTIDLDTQRAVSDLALQLAHELVRGGSENQIALREGGRYAARLARSCVAASLLEKPEIPVRLSCSSEGVLDRMTWTSAQRRAPGRGEVEIRVHATGLNFRDVMNALAMRADADLIGGECAGRVVAVGPDVDDITVGDDVVAIAQGSFATYVTVPSALVLPRPAGLTAAQAAGQSLAYFTAYYCLHHVAQLKQGETILIHAAAGGVGLAAVRLAKLLGAHVFATAGSQEKRQFLQTAGVDHVFDSRSTDFADAVLVATGGRGVDVVLNSLAGEFVGSSMRALASGGRFVEIGKRNVWTDAEAARARPDAAYHLVDLAEPVRADPASLRPVLVEALRLGAVAPLPVTEYHAAQVADAFRYMAQARHIGRIVVTYETADGAAPVPVRRDGSYLISGGLGALGLLTAEWLAAQHAGAIVLLARSEPTAESRVAVARIEEQGTRVSIARGDVACEVDVRNALALAENFYPLRGIVHAAGVLDDATLLRLDPQRYEAVLRPKVAGAHVLHSLTAQRQLDFFVLYSSVASVLGSSGQASHAAANAFLDAFAHQRQLAGLPALSIGWGIWSQIGSAAQRGAPERFATRGAGAIAPEDGVSVLPRLLAAGRTHVIVQPIDWPTFMASNDAADPLLAGIARETAARASAQGRSDAGVDRGRPTVVDRLRSLPAREQRDALISHVHDEVGEVIGLAAEQQIDVRQPLSELGVDSLMAVELRNRLATSLGTRSLPATLVFDYPTVELLADYLLSGALASSDQPQDRSPSRVTGGQPSPAIIDAIEQLSDADVAQIFAQLGD